MPDIHPHSLVIRGGLLADIDGLVQSIEDALEDGDGPVLSVAIGTEAPGESREDLRLRLCREYDFPNKQIRESTVERLLQAGFPQPTHWTVNGEPDCHFHIQFSASPSSIEVQTFVDCFDPAVLNPTGGKRRAT